MNIALWIVQSLLSLLLLSGGGYKLFQAPALAAQFASIPVGVWQVLGVNEIVGGLLLILPLALRWIGWISPLWHGTELGRVLTYGYDEPLWLSAIHILYLVALALLGFMEELLAGTGQSLLLITYPSTPFILPEHAEEAFDGDQEKIDRTRALHAYLRDNPDITVIASAWWNSYLRDEDYEDYFLAAIDWLLQQQHEVILLEDVPELPSAMYAHCLLKNMDDCSISGEHVQKQLQNFRRFQQQVRARFPQVQWINPREVICDGTRCETVLNGIPLYRDESHLNHRGSQEIGREYLRRLGNPLLP